MRHAHAITIQFTDPQWELTLQVRHDEDGLWHRRAVLFGYTACGKVATHKTTSQTRHESYEGNLCKGGCYAPFELAESERINKERGERE